MTIWRITFSLTLIVCWRCWPQIVNKREFSIRLIYHSMNYFLYIYCPIIISHFTFLPKLQGVWGSLKGKVWISIVFTHINWGCLVQIKTSRTNQIKMPYPIFPKWPRIKLFILTLEMGYSLFLVSSFFQKCLS